MGIRGGPMKRWFGLYDVLTLRNSRNNSGLWLFFVCALVNTILTRRKKNRTKAKRNIFRFLKNSLGPSEVSGVRDVSLSEKDKTKMTSLNYQTLYK